MPAKPVIGLVGDMRADRAEIYVADTYFKAVQEAGGLPIVLPYSHETDFMALLDLVDGLLLTGGGDIHPFFYGEEPTPCCGQLQPERDAFEMRFVPLAVRVGKPILGICRGEQAINVALGGTLYQDIPTQFQATTPLAHAQRLSGTYPAHTVALEGEGLLRSIIGAALVQVNTFHHQAVKEMAPGLRASARSRDGLIEAIEAVDGRFLLGVQWHPEIMVPKDPNALALFKALVNASLGGT